MPRRHSNASLERWKTPGSKGKGGRGQKRGSYSTKNKARRAKRYDTPRSMEGQRSVPEIKKRQRRKKR